MSLKDYKKEELQNMSYDDLAALVLEDAGKQMKIMDIFSKINEILELSPSEYENRIGDFFELLSTDKKFIMVDNGFWDLRSKHAPKIVVDEEDDTEDLVEDDVLEEDETEEEKDIFYEIDDNEDEADDDLKDLVIVDGDEEEQTL